MVCLPDNPPKHCTRPAIYPDISPHITHLLNEMVRPSTLPRILLTICPSSKVHIRQPSRRPLPALYLDLSQPPQGLSERLFPRLCVRSPRLQVAHLGDQPVRRQSKETLSLGDANSLDGLDI